MDEHTHGLKRRYTDAELRTHTVTELMDLAGDCDIEPADPTICDACAAMIIAQEKEADPQVEDFVSPQQVVRDGLLAIQVAANRDEWMARAMTAEAAVAELMVDKEATEAMVTRLTEKLGEATIAVARFAEKPWLFLPGDRVLCLMPTTAGDKLVAGVVQQIRIPGPIRPEKVVQVQLDEDVHASLGLGWWDPIKLERLGG